MTTAIAMYFLVVSFGDFPTMSSASTGTTFPVQTNRYGPMSEDECLKTARAMMEVPKFRATCTDGARWITVIPR